MLAIGEPKVEWEPKTNRWTGAELNAVLKGAATLEGPWEDVPAGGSPHHSVLQGDGGDAVTRGSPGTARPAKRPV